MEYIPLLTILTLIAFPVVWALNKISKKFIGDESNSAQAWRNAGGVDAGIGLGQFPPNNKKYATWYMEGWEDMERKLSNGSR